LPPSIREINDREPAMSKRNAGVTITPGAFGIGAPMAQMSRHLANRGQIAGSSRPRILKYARDATHVSGSDESAGRRGARRAEDQADGKREPHNGMTQDEMADAENGE
jgi:hypothetical protein